MAFTRITDTDLQGKGVIGQPEIPGLSALEMQQSVEQIVREVAIPGINRLAEELEADTGAAGIGMKRPAGMSEEVPAHVQAITAAHIEDRENPHAVTAAQVGAYTKQETVAAINNKVVEIGTGDMAQAIYAVNGEPGVVDTAVQARAADDGVKLYTHTRSGKVHKFTGSGPNGRALMTADVQAGDTFAVNGKTVSAWMGAESAVAVMEGQPYTGRWVTFVTEGDTLNFKGGGGLVTVEGLSAKAVVAGNTVTVKQGAKVVQQEKGTYYAGWIGGGGTDSAGNNAGSFIACDIPGVTVTRVSDEAVIPNPGSRTYSAGRDQTAIKCNKSFSAVCYTLGGSFPPRYNGSNLSNGQTFSYVAGRSIELNRINTACVIRVTSIPK